MKLPILLLATITALVLSACGSGPVKRVSPPTASIQELTIQADGNWKLLIRVQNFSNVPMTFSSINAELQVNGSEIGQVSSGLALDVPGESADVFTVTLAPTGMVRPADTGIAYRLHGKIESSEPAGTFDFERKSHLSPTPGLPGTWR
ncbi:hypothetical protein [Dokdonella sp.]|uniref:hypothetical protein n=1 Tax=Dokdonella sp. TaxID=2291710 RepID=UPI003C40D0E1